MPSIIDRIFGPSVAADPAPDTFEALCAQAAAATARGDPQGAATLYGAAIGLDGTRAEAHYRLGNALRLLGRGDEAIASYDAALQLGAGLAHAYCNRGTVQQALGRPEAALCSYDAAIGRDGRDALAHYNRGLVLQELGRWDEAIASYDRAVGIDPQYADAHYNRALAQLHCGDFVAGWRGYEWRWMCARRLSIAAPRQFPTPPWLGEVPLAGQRLLLYCEAGLGDTLQFCRYASLAAGRGATVLLEAQAPLLGLLGRLDGVAQVFAAGGAPPPYDLHCPLLSLPLAFGTTLSTVPSVPRYLRADPALVERWRVRLGPRGLPRVGLAWSGNPANTLDQRRSIALADWIPHLPAGFEYVRLQRDVRGADRATLGSSGAIVSPPDADLDFDNTAALCELMDVVVSVDTSIAHLAAALGRPTRILLPVHADWRWMRDRGDTPWYPTATLYRQRIAGDWRDVFARVAADLQADAAGSVP